MAMIWLEVFPSNEFKSVSLCISRRLLVCYFHVAPSWTQVCRYQANRWPQQQQVDLINQFLSSSQMQSPLCGSISYFILAWVFSIILYHIIGSERLILLAACKLVFNRLYLSNWSSAPRLSTLSDTNNSVSGSGRQLNQLTFAPSYQPQELKLLILLLLLLSS